MFELSELESSRFGLRIARASLVAPIDPGQLRTAVIQAQLDLLILRIAADQGSHAALLASTGLPALHADSLVTYACALQHTADIPASDPTLVLQVATQADAADIEALVDQVFHGYSNHYRANPLLSAELALAGYRQWALSHIAHADRLCSISRHDGVISGLACSSHAPDRGVAVGVLHGIRPEFGNRGIYTDLIRATQKHYRAAGYDQLKISTQVGNLPVQRVWVREGFRFQQVEHTWHLHPLLGRTLAAQPVAIRCGSKQELQQSVLHGCLDATANNTRLWLDPQCVFPATLRQQQSTMPTQGGGFCRTTVVSHEDGQLAAWAQSL